MFIKKIGVKNQKSCYKYNYLNFTEIPAEVKLQSFTIF